MLSQKILSVHRKDTVSGSATSSLNPQPPAARVYPKFGFALYKRLRSTTCIFVDLAMARITV